MATSPSTELQERDRRLAKQRMRATSNSSATDLHLPNLSIKGFRGIQDLTIAHLGRVTLFVGKNGAGKTTLLEAVRIYAARGRYPALVNILQEREELLDEEEDGDPILAPNWKSLFYGRNISSDALISIGPINENDRLNLEIAPFSKDNTLFLDVTHLLIKFQDKMIRIPMTFGKLGAFWREDSEFPPEIQCESLGPSLLSNEDIAQLWDKVALTDDEARSMQALNMIFNDKVERVAMISDSKQYGGRRAIVKIKGEDRPVPLKSIGNGAVRLFGIALALANCQDGFLVIDEAENGLHHSGQRAFWQMVIQTAHENNVQIFVTTHSWDCVAGFAQAASNLEEVECVLVRLDEDDDQVRAVEYSKKNLRVAAKQGIEVR